MEDRSKRLAGWAAVVVLCMFALGFASTLTNVYSDDAQISLRYAQRLLDGDGLTWTDGERVEGYSNFLWLMMAAMLGLFGVDLMTATRIFGVIGLVGLITAVSLGEDGRPDVKRALSGGAFVAVSGGFAMWAVAGLAHTFLAMIGVVALVAVRRSEHRAWLVAGSVLLATATLLRVDGFILAGAILVGTLLKTLAWRRVATLAIGPTVAAVSQQIFRVQYYDDWVPNTARVKVSFTYERAEMGFWWTLDALKDHGPLVAVASIAVLTLRRRSLDAAVPAVLWAAYTAYVGGDIFRGWRMLLPGLPMFAVLVADASPRFHRFVWPVIGALVVGQGAWNLQQHDAYRVPSRPDWTITTQVVAEALKEGFEGKDPFLAVDAAGALPYFTGFDAVDMLGLTDRFLPRHPPPDWGKGGIGHDLGDGRYIWRKKPDIIAFRSGLGGQPSFRSGRQMAARRDWAASYRPSIVEAMFEGHAIRGMYYFRMIDGPAAPVRSAHEVRFPGHLFGTHDTPVVLRDGALGPMIPAGQDVIVDLDLPPGHWSVALIGSGPMAAPISIDAPPKGPTALGIRAKGAPAHLTEIVLTRDTAPAQLDERVEGHLPGQD